MGMVTQLWPKRVHIKTGRAAWIDLNQKVVISEFSQWLRQLRDIGRDPARLGRMYAGRGLKRVWRATDPISDSRQTVPK
jgi:hypothetical protein